MRLTRNEHHRKLRALIRDISDWLVNADVSEFCRPLPCLSDVLQLNLPYLHDYLLPPTTTCCLPRLLPPMTTCYLPRLPAASHNCLVTIEPGDRTKL